LQALKHKPDPKQLFLQPIRWAVVLNSGRSQGCGPYHTHTSWGHPAFSIEWG